MNFCQVCHLGKLQTGQRLFIYRFGRQVMMVPNAPAEVCDVCGQVDYDPEFMLNLERLIREHRKQASKQAVIVVGQGLPGRRVRTL